MDDHAGNLPAKILCESAGLADWHYREIPWIIQDFMDELVEALGKENLHIITCSKMSRRQGTDTLNLVRASVLISPQGIERLKEYASSLS